MDTAKSPKNSLEIRQYWKIHKRQERTAKKESGITRNFEALEAKS